jgi:dTDP-4-dehydrorhamnose 3,5-epimerase
MKVTPLAIPEVLLIEPDVFGDERGFFFEAFSVAKYREQAGIDAAFVQDNVSRSIRGTLRGLHYQKPPMAQGKLVQVLEGAVLDVAVDIRFGSPTFGYSVSAELSSENHHQLWIPPGFAHGFLTLSETALFSYKCTNGYSPEHDRGVLWNDPALNDGVGTVWPKIEGIGEYLLSEKDTKQRLLKDIERDFEY